MNGSHEGGRFAPAAYWFWDRVPDPAEAKSGLRAMAAAGIARVMIQARLSLPRHEYLAPAYLRGYRAAVEAAREAGLRVTIYDEYNWMSGHGGGRTVQGAGHLRERHLFWTTSDPRRRPAQATVSEIASDWFDSLGSAGAEWIYDDGRRRFDEWELVAAVAHPPQDTDPASAVELTEWAVCAGADGGAVAHLPADAPLPAGWAVTFFLSARCASSRAINYLDRRAAERFLSVAYEPYLAALDGLIGDPVDGFSFDHPYGGFYRWREHAGEVLNSLMWHPPARLAEDDAELTPGRLLFAVTRGTGPRAAAARCRFFARYGTQAISSFFGPLRDWTDAHGVGLTGHELLGWVGGWELNGAFPELDLRTNFAADHFALDRARSETLVDAANFSAQLSPIMGDAVARAHGRQRCTVEQYAARRDPPEDFAAGYWELSLPELRLQTLRHHLLGARQLLVHAIALGDGSGDDERLLSNPRFDFPPACNFEPWFGHFAALARESAAVSRFIDEAEPEREVALVYPLHTLWAEGPRHAHGRRFGAWAESLARHGVGFDVVEDRALDGAALEAPAVPASGARIRLGGRLYRAVVLPAVTTLPSRRGADALEAFARAGGTVLASWPLPGATAADGPVAGLADCLAALSTVVPAGRLDDALAARLRGETLQRLVEYDVPGPTLWRWSGRCGAVRRIVLLNDNAHERRVALPELCVELAPGEVACLELEAPGVGWRRVGEPPAPRALADPAHRVSLAGGWTLAVPDAAPVEVDPDRGWEQQGLATFAGVGTYRCRFDRPPGAARARTWRLELPQVACAASARLNGRDLGARGWPPYRFAIPPDGLRARGNELEIEVASSAANHYYAGTRFARGPQPSGLLAAPQLTGA